MRPAVNTGLSVSRVGRAAQPKAMRKVSGTLRIELSQFREMAVFTRFGSDVDDATKRMLIRGHTLTELLKQPKSRPYSLFEEVALLVAYHNNIFESSPEDADLFAPMLTAFLEENCPELAASINRSGDLTDSDKTLLLEHLNRFKETLNGKHQ